MNFIFKKIEKLNFNLYDLTSFFILIFTTLRLFRHEMWRDEVQPFLIAAYADNFIDLFNKVSTEGHPLLWYAILFWISKFTINPYFVQILNWSLIFGIWILVFKFSPFTKLEKILLMTSYFFFFEYSLISRNYSMTIFFGFLYIVITKNFEHKIILRSLILGLLANTTVFGAIWSMCFIIQSILNRVEKLFISSRKISKNEN